ncbi:MAG: MarR family winged helix-turn-helix transcriptional regulator [Bauldia sp.]
MALDHRKMVTHRLGQAARACRARVGAGLAAFDLHAGQEGILKALAEEDGQSMSELAADLAVQPPTVTKMVSRLAAQGYLERRAGTNGDARQAHVFLTKQGRSVVDSIDRVMKRVERDALAGIDEKDQKRLRRLLRQLEENLTGTEADDDRPGLSRSLRNPMEGL